MNDTRFPTPLKRGTIFVSPDGATVSHDEFVAHVDSKRAERRADR